MPKLTIIIPAYNVANYITRTIESLLGQKETLKDIEIIVINDGSADDTQRIVNDKVDAHPEADIRIINTKNQGVSAARNDGLMYAKGDYIFFLDGDDYVSDGMTSTVLAALKDNEPDMLVWGYARVDETGKPLDSDYFVRFSFPEASKKGSFVLDEIFRANGRFWIWTGSVIYRRKWLVESGVSYTPGCSCGEDQEFIIKALSNAAEVAFLPEVLSFYLYRVGSATHVYNIRRLDSIEALERARDYLANRDSVEFESVIKYLSERWILQNFVETVDSCIDCLLSMRGITVQKAVKMLLDDIGNCYPTMITDLESTFLSEQSRHRYHAYMSGLVLSTYLRKAKKRIYQVARKLRS